MIFTHHATCEPMDDRKCALTCPSLRFTNEWWCNAFQCGLERDEGHRPLRCDTCIRVEPNKGGQQP